MKSLLDVEFQVEELAVEAGAFLAPSLKNGKKQALRCHNHTWRQIRAEQPEAGH
jgi:hypothetical protein